MLRHLAAQGILNSPMGSNAYYIDPETGQRHDFRVMVHNEFNLDWDQNVNRQTEMSYRPTEELNLILESLIAIHYPNPDESTYWRVSSVVEFNGSLTRVALKPSREVC